MPATSCHNTAAGYVQIGAAALEFVLPRKGALDSHASCMDGGVEQPLAPALGVLAVTQVFFDVDEHTSIENALPIEFLVLRCVHYRQLLAVLETIARKQQGRGLQVPEAK